MSESNLLTSVQMAHFASDGFVRFDNIIDRDLCDEFYKHLQDPAHKTLTREGALLEDVWPADSPIRRVFFHPRVKGVIQSLVGPNPRYDHHAAHETHPGGSVQILHQDSEYDPRRSAFDIQLSFFPQDTPLNLGGTRFLPSSHFRRVNESVVGRYQHVRGMTQIVCEAGTLVAWHANLWHGAQPNTSPDRLRYMFKLRLNPMVKQQRLFNTSDLGSDEILPILGRAYPWHGQSHRRECINRIHFWRLVSGQPDFDFNLWLTRVSNVPQAIYSNQA